jgi:hypothetical protein
VKKRDLQPHLIRSGLTPGADPQRDEPIEALCAVSQEAPQVAKQGERTRSTDEVTGVQALERKHPRWPLAPAQVERREFESMGHGTGAFSASRDVVSAKIVAPHAGPTRTEEDFLAHVQALVASDPQSIGWPSVCEHLHLHHSEALVRGIADLWGVQED